MFDDREYVGYDGRCVLRWLRAKKYDILQNYLVVSFELTQYPDCADLESYKRTTKLAR